VQAGLLQSAGSEHPPPLLPPELEAPPVLLDEPLEVALPVVPVALFEEPVPALLLESPEALLSVY